MTPTATDRDDHYRHREVVGYLRTRGAPEPWVAIDDDPLHYPPGCNVVLIDSARGFDAEAARRLLAAIR